MRDRKPAVRFSSTAYVLPRTGQRGIPVISVNTKTVAVEIYRISDRNLVDAIAGVTSYDRGDFQRSLDRSDIERLKESRGVQVWKGDLAVELGADQPGRHHGISGRPGGRRSQTRRLRHGGAAAGAEKYR